MVGEEAYFPLTTILNTFKLLAWGTSKHTIHQQQTGAEHDAQGGHDWAGHACSCPPHPPGRAQCLCARRGQKGAIKGPAFLCILSN